MSTWYYYNKTVNKIAVALIAIVVISLVCLVGWNLTNNRPLSDEAAEELIAVQREAEGMAQRHAREVQFLHVRLARVGETIINNLQTPGISDFGREGAEEARDMLMIACEMLEELENKLTSISAFLDKRKGAQATVRLNKEIRGAHRELTLMSQEIGETNKAILAANTKMVSTAIADRLGR